MKINAYLSLGSNIDDRLAHLNAAKQQLSARKDIRIQEESRVYETEPWPKEEDGNRPHAEKGQKWFLNQVICATTSLSPEKLLKVAQDVEKKLGRTKKHHLGPREIDIDILLYNSDIIDLPHLQIPHRHMRDRRFVLEPLTEIAPNLKDPVTGEKYTGILKNLGHEYEVMPFL